MKRLRNLHLYLGCVFAPLVLLFAVTGATQVFGIRLGLLSEAHTKGYGSLPFMILSSVMGLSVAATSAVGVALAFRLGNDRKKVWACLAFGTLVPAALLIIAHFKR